MKISSRVPPGEYSDTPISMLVERARTDTPVCVTAGGSRAGHRFPVMLVRIGPFVLGVDPVERDHALVQIVGGQMRIVQRHLDRLVAEKCLHPAQVDARLDPPRRAGVAQHVGHELRIVLQPHVPLHGVPVIEELLVGDAVKRAAGLAPLIGQRTDGTIGQRNGATPAGFGDPEGGTAIVDIAMFQAERFADARASIDQENAQVFVGFVAFFKSR